MTERPDVVDRKPWDDCQVCRDYLATLPQASLDELTWRARTLQTSRAQQTLEHMEKIHEAH